MTGLEKDVIRKITWRLLPVLIFSYFIAILDRANVGVAALTMNQDLGLSTAAFGFAAGVFFVPYVLLELPSNLALERFGARWWIARIMLTWGLISAAHALVWSAESLYVLRALLGAAEAGFFPGVVFYLTLWFPAAYRGRIMSMFNDRDPAGARPWYTAFHNSAGDGWFAWSPWLAMDVHHRRHPCDRAGGFHSLPPSEQAS
jgi:MFS family permease